MTVFPRTVLTEHVCSVKYFTPQQTFRYKQDFYHVWWMVAVKRLKHLWVLVIIKKKSKFSYFFSQRHHLTFNSLPQFCTSISGTLIFCGWLMAISITVTQFKPRYFDPLATHIYCNSPTAFLHQHPISYITFFFTLCGRGETKMYQFLTSHQFPFIIFPELCLSAEVFLVHTGFQPNILFREY